MEPFQAENFDLRFPVLTVKTEIVSSKSIPRVLANIQDLFDTLRIPDRGH